MHPEGELSPESLARFVPPESERTPFEDLRARIRDLGIEKQADAAAAVLIWLVPPRRFVRRSDDEAPDWEKLESAARAILAQRELLTGRGRGARRIETAVREALADPGAVGRETRALLRVLYAAEHRVGRARWWVVEPPEEAFDYALPAEVAALDAAGNVVLPFGFIEEPIDGLDVYRRVVLNLRNVLAAQGARPRGLRLWHSVAAVASLACVDGGRGGSSTAEGVQRAYQRLGDEARRHAVAPDVWAKRAAELREARAFLARRAGGRER